MATPGPIRSVLSQRYTSSSFVPSQNPPISPPAPPAMVPVVRITRPSMPPPTEPPPPAPDLAIQASTDREMRPFASVAAIMASDENRLGPGPPKTSLATPARDSGERPIEGRPQTARRNLVGAGSFIARIASRPSLVRLRSAPVTTPLLLPNTTSNSPNTTLGVPDTARFRQRAQAPDYRRSQPKYAASSARQPSPVSSQHLSLQYAQRSQNTSLLPGRAQSVAELVEIPRFKKRSLNLGILRHSGPWQRMAWIGLWLFWLLNGLSSLFFDVNVMYILVQCVIHPSYDPASKRSWTFASAAYALCWGLSTMIVWLGWEVGYEFWRRWRLPRPAIEPIYLSLPATLHLALTSYPHFTFFLHIRLSPLGTPYAMDVIPETCHALVQLAPGLLPLLVRGGISVVILVAFWRPELNVQTPFGSTDQTPDRDPHFFQTSAPGQLTIYGKGVLLAFVACVGLRLVIVLLSIIGLWVSSRRPLGGLFRPRTFGIPQVPVDKPEMSTAPRDPSRTASPQKSWLSAENEFDWVWRERTRARIQDAFELCIVRKVGRVGSSQGEFLQRNRSIPVDMAESGEQGISTLTSFSRPEQVTGSSRPDALMPPNPALDSRSSLSTQTPMEPPRPESSLDPTGRHLDESYSSLIQPTSSRLTGRSAVLGVSQVGASTSSHDLFYTPAASNTPATEKARSIFEMSPAVPVPSSSYTLLSGNCQVTDHPTLAANGVESDSEDWAESGADSDGEDSTGLLGGAMPSAHNSNNSLRRRIAALGVRSETANTDGSDPLSSSSRRKVSTVTGSVKVLSRARSASISLLREGVHNVGAASILMRKAKSGTMLGGAHEYSKVSGPDNRSELIRNGGTERRRESQL